MFCVLETLPAPLPLPSTKTVLIFLFLRQRRSQHLHNTELGGGSIRELTLDANKIEQVLQCRKVSFSVSVSTTFVVHYSCKNRENHFVTSLELNLVTATLNFQLGDRFQAMRQSRLYPEELKKISAQGKLN